MKEAWQRQLLELPNGISSHDTFNSMLARLDGQNVGVALSVGYNRGKAPARRVVSVDGKKLLWSYDTVIGKEAAWLVNAPESG